MRAAPFRDSAPLLRAIGIAALAILATALLALLSLGGSPRERTVYLTAGPGGPQALELPFAAFDAVAIDRIDGAGSAAVPDRTTRLARYRADQLTLDGGGPFVRAPIDPMPPGTRLAVTFDRPYSGFWSSVRLVPEARTAGWQPVWLALATLASGLVLAALLASVLAAIRFRQRFILWYSVLTLGMFVEMWCTAALIGGIVPLSMAAMALVLKAGHTMIVVGAVYFTAHFLERFALSPAMRIALRIVGALMPAVFALQLLGFPVAEPVFYATFLPPCLVLSAAIAMALTRGSRWARYQAVGWLPPIAVATGMGVFGVTGWDIVPHGPFVLIGVILFEIFVTAIGVIDRLVSVRREAKDSALLAKRDPLTGLYNRRVLERDLGTYLADGYTQCALVDLDLFRQANEQFGPAIGDAVLRASAKAIRACPDAVGFRIRGDEFVMLLRTGDRGEAAERCRQAIATAIAADVSQIARPITASMGVVDLSELEDRDAVEFVDIYAQADALLYRAKARRGNRSLFEPFRIAPPPAKGAEVVPLPTPQSAAR